jgi:Hydantoinase B/oxoprolinase
MVQAIRELPSRTLVGQSTHDPYPGLPEGIPLKVQVRIDADEARIELDLTENPDNYPGGLNESRACATANSIIGLFNSIDPDIPHNAGSFRRVTVVLREGCIAGIPRFPHSCSMATTNVADRLVSITQAAFAELGDAGGWPREGWACRLTWRSSPVSITAMETRRSSTRCSSARAVGRRTARRRLADVPDPRVRLAGLQGQRRGRRAATDQATDTGLLLGPYTVRHPSPPRWRPAPSESGIRACS